MGNTTNVIEELQHKCAMQEQQIAELTTKLNWFEEQYRLSQQKQYGRSSEQTQEQLQVFNEAEALADASLLEPELEEITYKRRKQKGQREAKLNDLPEEIVEHRLPLDEQVCPCCSHRLHEMGTQAHKELKIVPAQASVVHHIQYIYACRRCEQENTKTPIITAPKPAAVLPRSLASPSAIAHTMNQKYVEAMPLYRQEQAWARLGVELSRQTLANWVIQAAERWLFPLYERMHEHLLKEGILHADESDLQVLREPGRSATSKSYLWLYRTGRGSPQMVLYDYRTTRAHKHPKKFLAGFKGYLHVDGYSGYHGIPDVTLVGCWAHARRKFDEALKALPKDKRAADVAAKQGLAFCNRLFDMERALKDVTPRERYELRLKKSRPVLDAFFAWLHQQRPKVLPKSAFGQAIAYCLNQWSKLESFLQDGQLELDNNRAERSIKPFVIGRKNWLFSNTPRGARASATIYSIVETAKENGLNPFRYLQYLFEKMPNLDIQDKDVLDELLPWAQTLPPECQVKR